MGTTELLPCPFCGGEAKLVSTASSTVQCQNDQCIIGDPAPFNDFSHREDAIAAWNCRTTPDLPERGGWPHVGFGCHVTAGKRYGGGWQDCIVTEVHDDGAVSVNRLSDGEKGLLPLGTWELKATPAPAGELEEMLPTDGQQAAQDWEEALAEIARTAKHKDLCSFWAGPWRCNCGLKGALANLRTHPGATTKGIE
ncbi:Lar family restriction alleviation protein [Sphingomonas crocodyli]